MREKKRTGDRGVAAVEFALVLLPMMILVTEAINWGWYFHVRHVVTNAAREGARLGVTLPPPAGCPSPITGGVADQVNARVRQVMTLSGYTTAVSCQTIPAVAGAFGLAVTVNFPRTRLIKFMVYPAAIPADMPVSETVFMRWE